MKRWRTLLVVVGGVGCLVVLAASAGSLAADLVLPPPPADAQAVAPGNGASALDEYFVEIPLSDRPPTSGRTKPATPPSPTPAPPPDSNPEIDALVKQLGDADYRQREAAVSKLKEIGPAALPAVKRAAAEATDPEVISRASGVARFLERPALPGGTGNGQSFPDTGFGVPGTVNLRMKVENGMHRVEVREHNGRVIRIDSGPNGINMSVAGQEDGKPVTRHFQARTPEDLKRQNPEAFELFERWTGRKEAMLRRRAPVGVRRGWPAAPGIPVPPPPNGGMQEMQDLLRRHLDPAAADAAARHHEDVMRMFEQMRRHRGLNGVDPFEEIAERMRRDREAILRDVEAIHERLRAAEGAGDEGRDAKE